MQLRLESGAPLTVRFPSGYSILIIHEDDGSVSVKLLHDNKRVAKLPRFPHGE